MLKTLKGLITAGALLVTLVTFATTYVFVLDVHEKSLEKRVQKESELIARQTFGLMYEIMKEGWTREKLEDFLKANQAAFGNSSYELLIHRGKKVEELFGEIPQKVADENVLEAYLTRSSKIAKSENKLHYVYPMPANTECLKCHVNVNKGDVLGVIEISQDLGDDLSSAKSDFLLSLLLVAPFPFAIAFLGSIIMSKRVNGYIAKINGKIENISKFSDLKEIEAKDVDLGIKELNEISRGIGKLAAKLKGIAVDKDILEFEIKLLEKFVITSEVIRDWHDHVKKLLLETNTIIPSYTLFSIFKVDEEVFDLEVFWVNTPSQRTKEIFEAVVRKQLAQNLHFRNDLGVLNVNHSIADISQKIQELDERDIELRVKSLIIDKPKIGGIVGIGLQAGTFDDRTKLLVIESILSTLLNVVGSLKAIHKYTKDLEYYATRDPLTNLYNQRVFWEFMGYEIERARRHDYIFALLVVDLDNFKAGNDTYGHTFGDKFLQEVSCTIKESLRGEDIFSRYGGDEFAIILPDVNVQQAFVVAERIRNNMEEFAIDAHEGFRVKATISIGMAVFPEHAADAKDLFLFADNMMYKAKTEGKNRIGIPTEEDIIEIFKKTGEMSMIIQEAIEQKRIIPYFQPIADTKTGEIAAYEVLSRIEADGRILNASEFIEIAEKMGVINKMDSILMENACKKIQKSGYRGKLFVNLSPKALIFSQFIPSIKEYTKQYGIDPSRIIFELTERETVKNLMLLEKFVIGLKNEGFKFAIDDFGSGFSSFHYLKRLPIDIVKIEGEFIRSMARDPKDRAFVKSIATLAKILGMKTVAEYVEDEEVMRSIRELDANYTIDYVQGYHIGKPSADFL